MDVRIPGFLLAAAVLAFFTLRGEKSGEVINRASLLQRTQYPRIFAAMIIMRWMLVAAGVVLALALLLGWLR